MSDHDLVTINLGYNFLCPKPEETCSKDITHQQASEERSLCQFNFSKANFEKLNEEFANVDWNNLTESNSEENFVDAFYNTIFEICKKNVPLKSKPDRSKKPSDNLDATTLRILRSLSRKRRKMKKHLEFLKTFQPHSPSIKVLSNKLKAREVESKDTIINDKRSQERKAVAAMKAKPRFFYSYAKRFSKRKSRVGPLKLIKGNSIALINDPKGMADVLQDQFKSVFSDPDCINTDEYDCEEAGNNIGHPTLSTFNFTIEDIIKAIDEIKSSSSSGKDGITAPLLKNCKETHSYHSYLIWKYSFDSGTIHKTFLTQMITPVHKKRFKIETCELPTNIPYVTYY